MSTLVTRRKALRGLAISSLLAFSLTPILGLAASRRNLDKLALLKKYGDDPIKTFYIQKDYLTSANDVMKLHMFFSPRTIPMGMIRSEVRQCMEMYDLRQEYNWIYSRMNSQVMTVEIEGKTDFMVVPSFGSASLPEEFIAMGPMTRERFAIGVRAFHEKLAKWRERYARVMGTLTPAGRHLLENQFMYYGMS